MNIKWIYLQNNTLNTLIVYHNRSDHNFDIKNVVLIKIENVLKVH